MATKNTSDKGDTAYRASMKHDARWIIESGGMTRGELSQYFNRSAGWVTHLLNGAWREIRVTPDQATLMRAIRRREQSRALLPGKIYADLNDAQMRLGHALSKLDRVEKELHNLRRRAK